MRSLFPVREKQKAAQEIAFPVPPPDDNLPRRTKAGVLTKLQQIDDWTGDALEEVRFNGALRKADLTVIISCGSLLVRLMLQ